MIVRSESSPIECVSPAPPVTGLGGRGNDRVRAGRGNDRFWAGRADFIKASHGADRLNGGPGNDTMLAGRDDGAIDAIDCALGSLSPPD
jgi:Ca2+-binding RTX toxin-like protein